MSTTPEPFEPQVKVEVDHRRVLEHAAFVDVGAMEIVRATGADRVSFLQRLVTGPVEGVPVGRGAHSLLLTTKGQVVLDLRLFVRPDELRLVVAPGQGTTAAAALARYAVMDDFAALPDPDARLLALYGPRAPGLLQQAGVSLPGDLATGPAWSHADVDGPDGPLWVILARGYGTSGLWIWGAPPALAGLEQRLVAAGIGRLRDDVAEALRVLAGEPRFGVEITTDYFPMEVGLAAAIDYGKGCFLGQEPIIRIRDRGHINWRLVGLRLRDDQPVAPGDRLEADVKPKAGRVTSVARLPGELPVALALLHVSVTAGTEVRVHHGDRTHVADVVEVPVGA